MWGDSESPSPVCSDELEDLFGAGGFPHLHTFNILAVAWLDTGPFLTSKFFSANQQLRSVNWHFDVTDIGAAPLPNVQFLAGVPAFVNSVLRTPCNPPRPLIRLHDVTIDEDFWDLVPYLDSHCLTGLSIHWDVAYDKNTMRKIGETFPQLGWLRFPVSEHYSHSRFPCVTSFPYFMCGVAHC